MIDDHDTTDAGAARYCSTGQPRPPAPTTRTDEAAKPTLADGTDLAEHGLAGVTVGHVACLVAAIQALACGDRVGIVHDVADHGSGVGAGLKAEQGALEGHPPMATSGRSPISFFHSPMRSSALRRERHLLERGRPDRAERHVVRIDGKRLSRARHDRAC